MSSVMAPSVVISKVDRMKRAQAECPYQDREPRDVICYWVDVKFT